MGVLLAFWNVLAMMAPWLLGGFLLAGLVGRLIPREWVIKVMGASRGWRGVLNAVLLGVPLPICSCGVLPLAAGLRKAGAGRGATAGFLISTPQTGVDSICATYALMGPVFAIARPLAAFATGLVGGFAVDAVGGAEQAQDPQPKTCCCKCHCGGHGHAEAPVAARRPLVLDILNRAYNELLGEIVRPLVVGLVISAAVTVFVPDAFFAEVFGARDWLAMPTMVLIGFPMYVCSTASIPIAASLVLKGLTPGAAFVFLMVGPAINAASLATVSRLIGARATIVYAVVIGLGAIACGVLVNLLPFDVLPTLKNCCSTGATGLFEHLCGGVLAALVVWHLVKGAFPHGPLAASCR
ncbi:MAG: SO_0444 family Cu/Zn efflux transporter [Kiritimatiellia bacterium]